jgi:hypothetical protein
MQGDVMMIIITTTRSKRTFTQFALWGIIFIEQVKLGWGGGGGGVVYTCV